MSGDRKRKMQITQFGKIIRRSVVCVLCSARPADTKEHIPPKGFFLKMPREYLAVPACRECNGSTKLEDEYLRHFLVAALKQSRAAT